MAEKSQYENFLSSPAAVLAQFRDQPGVGLTSPTTFSSMRITRSRLQRRGFCTLVLFINVVMLVMWLLTNHIPQPVFKKTVLLVQIKYTTKNLNSNPRWIRHGFELCTVYGWSIMGARRLATPLSAYPRRSFPMKTATAFISCSLSFSLIREALHGL